MNNIKIYYEDTDASGRVYHANYLKYLERARTEALFSIGFSNKKVQDKYNSLIIVKSCNIEYKKPAKFEDKLEIISEVLTFTKTSFIMKQEIMRKDEKISTAEIHLVAVDKNGKPKKIPEELKQKLQN